MYRECVLDLDMKGGVVAHITLLLLFGNSLKLLKTTIAFIVL